jgi:hypothetical protein
MPSSSSFRFCHGAAAAAVGRKCERFTLEIYQQSKLKLQVIDAN